MAGPSLGGESYLIHVAAAVLARLRGMCTPPKVIRHTSTGAANPNENGVGSPRLTARRSATSPIRTPRPRDGQTVVRTAIFGMSEIVLRWYWTSAAPECRLSPRKMPWSNYVSAGRSFCRCRSHRN